MCDCTRNGQFNQQQIGENICNQVGPQSPLGVQNSSWSSIASNNTLINHSGVECDVNTINYGQPPPGLNAQQHQQQQQQVG